jgi:hypothetical protein
MNDKFNVDFQTYFLGKSESVGFWAWIRFLVLLARSKSTSLTLLKYSRVRLIHKLRNVICDVKSGFWQEHRYRPR